MSDCEILENDGVESIFVHRATVSALAEYLDPEIPWVWILGHTPHRYIEWWRTSLPLFSSGPPIEADFRCVQYDLMLPTRHFLKLATEFDDHGIALIQSRNRMPDTLDLARIDGPNQKSILRQNGAFLRIYLPHAIETAQIQCFEKGYLASLFADEEQ